jgi:prepilin-type processing-associated H-X9-DG protein
MEEHSYILNAHLAGRGIRFGSRPPKGLSASDLVLMGEKRSDYPDYYMDPGNYSTRVELFRHGLRLGSNYLFLDLHVGTLKDVKQIAAAIDPWDVGPTP